MEPPEIIEIEDVYVACDGNGNGGALGHPRVYLTMGHNDHVDCPYCSRRFVLKPGARRAAAGH